MTVVDNDVYAFESGSVNSISGFLRRWGAAGGTPTSISCAKFFFFFPWDIKSQGLHDLNRHATKAFHNKNNHDFL